MMKATLHLIQLLASASCNYEDPDAINPPTSPDVSPVDISSAREDVCEVPKTENDMIFQFPRLANVRQEIYDSISTKANLTSILKIGTNSYKDIDALIELADMHCFRRLSNIVWFPSSASSAMRVYRKYINTEKIDQENESDFRGENALAKFYEFYCFLKMNEESLKEDTPHAFCKAIFQSLQSVSENLHQSLSDYGFLSNENFNASLIYDCLSFSKDLENLGLLVESMSWEEFFDVAEEYLLAKIHTMQYLMKILYTLKYHPMYFDFVTSNGVHDAEFFDVITLMRTMDP